jgi:hypothetical protein
MRKKLLFTSLRKSIELLAKVEKQLSLTKRTRALRNRYFDSDDGDYIADSVERAYYLGFRI